MVQYHSKGYVEVDIIKYTAWFIAKTDASCSSTEYCSRTWFISSNQEKFPERTSILVVPALQSY